MRQQNKNFASNVIETSELLSFFRKARMQQSKGARREAIEWEDYRRIHYIAESWFHPFSCVGGLLRRLEITNVKSIRTYFHSLVSSQLYGLESFSFQVDDYYRAAKLFLQTIFCLPDSYPINIARSLLNLQIFESISLNSRIRFIQRAFLSPVSDLSMKALEYNQTVLMAHGTGFTHDLVSFLSTFFDVSDLDDLSVSDLSYLQDLRDQIVHQSKGR
jgi:hypothetical protein